MATRKTTAKKEPAKKSIAAEVPDEEPVEEKAPEPTVFDKLFALEPELRQGLVDQPDRIKTPLLNILGDFSHLRDSIKTEFSLYEKRVIE